MLYLLLAGAAILLGCIFWRFGGKWRSDGRRKLLVDETHISGAKTTKHSTQATNDTSSLDRLGSNERSGDQRILEEYPWESYKEQRPAVKEAMELVVFRSLLLSFRDVSYDACSACLQSHDDVRDLLLEGWRKDSFELLRSNAIFLSLIKATLAVRTDAGGLKQGGNDEEHDRNEASKSTRIEHSVDNEISQSGDVNIYGGKFVNASGGVYNVAGDVWRITYSNDDSRRTAEWFISIDYRATHNEIAKKRSKNTGGWLLQSETYGEWCSTHHRRILWCPGIPGVGKTVMASLIIDHLRTFDESQVFVGVIYFNYKLRSQQSKLAILEALCRQMFELHHSSTFKNLYDSHEKQRSRPTETELRSILSATFHEFRTCFLVLDALDEFAEHYSDREVREVINVILSLGENVKLLITSRVLGEMTATFEELGASREEIIADDADIRMYLAERVTSLKSRLDFEVLEAFSVHIIEKVIEAAKGRFLVAELGMNLLAEQLNLGDLEDALDHLPHEIDETYVRVMELIRNYPDSRRELALKALMWVAYASRPLSVGALQHALAIKHGKKDIDKYITPLSTITSLCAGLIVVQDAEWHHPFDDERLVRFVHFTTQEFFGNFLSRYFPDAHKAMFSTCIEYLRITGNHILPADFDWHQLLSPYKQQVQQQVHLPFYDYAALDWGYHANAHHESLDQEVLEFLSGNDRSILLSCNYVLKQWYHVSMEHDLPGIFLAAYHEQTHALSTFLHRAGNAPCATTQTTAMHIAAISGRTNMLIEILQWSKSSQNDDCSGISEPSTIPRWQEKHITQGNMRDLYGRTPLTYAATYGHESIAKLLIDHGNVEVDSRDDRGMTPFAYAAQYGSGSIIELLLSCDGIQIDSKDEDGRTPFSHAAWSGNHSIVTLLLEQGGVEVDSKDNNGRTAFSYVAQYGNEPTFNVLLEHGDVEIDSKANNGRTPFSYAAEMGHQPIIRLLLDHGGIQVDSKDGSGRTPFSYAAQRGQDSIVRLLLERRAVEADSKDNNGRSPLSFAAEYSSESVIKQLLEDPGVDVDSMDNYGRTPFSYAAERGSESIVSIFLRHGGTDVGSKDHNGRSPFSHANSSIWRTAQDTEAVLKLLLTHPGVDVDFKDNHGRTPLSYAAEHGLEQAIKLLLQHGGVEVDTKDNVGRTPFSYAVGAGKKSITMLLVGHGGLEVDSKDANGRTPLSHIAQNGVQSMMGLYYFFPTTASCLAETDEESIVQILLELGVTADSRDSHGRTPFSYAAASGKLSIMELLLEDGKVEVDSKDKDGRTPLSHAAQGNRESTCKFLLQYGGIGADSKDNWGRTALSYAAEHGAESVARLLVRTGVDADSMDNYGRTPLSYAARRGQEPIIRLLFDHGQVEMDSKDKFGRDAISYAAQSGADSVIKLLEEAGVDVDSKDEHGRTPLSYAAAWGAESTIKLLLERGNVHINSRDNCGRTPLSHAATAYDELSMQLLLEHVGVEVDSRDDNGQTPFSHAAQFGRESVIRLLLQHGGIEVDSKDNVGQTPLSYAAQMGGTSTVKLILEHGGVDVNSKDSLGRTPLTNAVCFGREETAKLLLEHGGVEVDSKDNNGRNTLSLAATWGQESMVRFILDHGGVELDSKDLHGRTPFSHAAEHGAESIVKLLIEHGGVQVHTQDDHGRSPLSWASSGAGWWDGNESSLLSTIRIILAQGVDVNLADNEGRTPLYYAKQGLENHGGSFKCVVDLLEANGAVELPSSTGDEAIVSDTISTDIEH